MPANNELVVPIHAEVKTNRSLEVMGLIVAASPNGEGDLAKMQTAFGSIGMGRHAPEMRSLKEALRVALVQKFSKKNRRVAPCGKGYEVVEEREVPGTLRNEHIHILSAYVENDLLVIDAPTFVLDGVACTDDDVRIWASEARRKVDGTMIGSAIAEVCMSLGGVPIRDAGGAYWLPSTAIDTFMAFKAALDNAGHPVRLNVMDMANTPRSVESTIVRIEALVDSTCDEILTAAETEGLGVRALETKATQAVNLVDRLNQYEKVLATGLTSLKQRVYAAQQAAVDAAAAVHREKEQQMIDRRLAAQQADADSIA